MEFAFRGKPVVAHGIETQVARKPSADCAPQMAGAAPDVRKRAAARPVPIEHAADHAIDRVAARSQARSRSFLEADLARDGRCAHAPTPAGLMSVSTCSSR